MSNPRAYWLGGSRLSETVWRTGRGWCHLSTDSHLLLTHPLGGGRLRELGLATPASAARRVLRLDSDLLLPGREAYAAAAREALKRYGELMGVLMQEHEAAEADDEARRTRVRELQARTCVRRLLRSR